MFMSENDDKSLRQIEELHEAARSATNGEDASDSGILRKLAVEEKVIDPKIISRMLSDVRTEIAKHADAADGGWLRADIDIPISGKVVSLRRDIALAFRIVIDEALCDHTCSDLDACVQKHIAEMQASQTPEDLAQDDVWRAMLQRLAANHQRNPKVFEDIFEKELSPRLFEKINKGHPIVVQVQEDVYNSVREATNGMFECLERHLFAGYVRRKTEKRMRNPERWDENIIVPGLEHLDQIREVSNSVVIPTGQLVALTQSQSMSRSKQKARDHAEEFGFFIDPTDDEYLRTALTSDQYLRYAIQDDGKILAYYFLRIGDAAEQYLVDDHGLQPGKTYVDASQLPGESGKGYKVHWSNTNKAIEVLSDYPSYAVGGEICVSQEAQTEPGLATALKARMYGDIERRGIPYIMIMYAEVTGVNGKTIDPLVNKGSRAMINLLDGKNLGDVQKKHTRSLDDSSIDLDVTWHTSWAEVRQSLEILHSLRQPD